MKKRINKYLGALAMGTALMAVPSCTDTWNEHYQTEDAYTATESLWELLEKREELSNFCSIVGKAKFYRDENHPAYTVNGKDTLYYTFKDILNANSPITVWAPTNNALTNEEWENLEEMVLNDGYNLQQQFVGNHIALYRKTMTKSGKESIRLINNKFAVINYDESTLQNAKVARKNIGARNGLLHILENHNEFLYNLYEYIKFSGELEIFSQYIIQRDTIVFWPDASIQGPPDENGNPTYVDSVYYLNNKMFNSSSYFDTGDDSDDAWMNNIKMFKAEINHEDSSYVMIVPTDMAWQNATEKLKGLYKYASTYPRMDKLKDDTKLKISKMDIFNAKKSYTTGKGYETVDSLQTVNIDMDIIYPLVFNVNLQQVINNKPWTMEEFINGGYKECEYLITTTEDTIRDIYELQNGVKTLVWSKNSLFEDQDIKEIKKMSNGYAVITDKWNYARDYWMRDIDIDVSTNYYYKSSATRPNLYNINNTTAAIWIDKYGRCSEQQYLHVGGAAPTTSPEIVFGLTGNKNHPLYDSRRPNATVMSGKYDIQIVLVPLWYNNSAEEPDTIEGPKGNKLECTLYYWDESLIDGKNYQYKEQKKLSTKIDYNGEKVDTITIMSDVEFPVSYKNLNNTYPVLAIKSIAEKKDVDQNGYSRYFNIDRIILKSKQSE